MLESAAEKEIILKKKVASIGNIVHESVPTNNNEVCYHLMHFTNILLIKAGL